MESEKLNNAVKKVLINKKNRKEVMSLQEIKLTHFENSPPKFHFSFLKDEANKFHHSIEKEIRKSIKNCILQIGSVSGVKVFKQT